MQNIGTLSVLIVDSHELIREGMARLLNDTRDIAVVGQLGSGEAVLEYLSCAGSNDMQVSENASFTTSRYQMPDVVMLDARMSGDARVSKDSCMPSLAGIEVIRAILQHSPDCKILAMSSCANAIIPSQILRSGARGFITKSASVEELLKAVRTVGAGDCYVTPHVATQLAVNPLDENADKPIDKLSRRELQISLMLSEGMKVSQIASGLQINPKTVYSYRYRVFEKLGISSDVELTILALEHGLDDYT